MLQVKRKPVSRCSGAFSGAAPAALQYSSYGPLVVSGTPLGAPRRRGMGRERAGRWLFANSSRTPPVPGLMGGAEVGFTFGRGGGMIQKRAGAGVDRPRPHTPPACGPPWHAVFLLLVHTWSLSSPGWMCRWAPPAVPAAAWVPYRGVGPVESYTGFSLFWEVAQIWGYSGVAAIPETMHAGLWGPSH